MSEEATFQSANMQIDRSSWINLLKGIAILTVVFYHMGLMDYGYLGVDSFLVVNGYLITGSLLRSFEEGNASYFSFLLRRLYRLWPLVLLAGFFSLITGLITMLPDDLENLAESVVASNFFTNNILGRITTANYWDIVNEYKPLMHTWYLGIVFQFYLVYPLIFFVAYKLLRKAKKHLILVIAALTLVSLILFILPGNEASKFYYLPYRFFEFSCGGLTYLLTTERPGGAEKKYYWIGVPLLLFIFIPNAAYISAHVKLLITVGLSCLSIQFRPEDHAAIENKKIYVFLSSVGIASYSIYIWHQVILAFYRYIFSARLSLIDYVLCIAIISLVSWLSYRQIEVRVEGLVCSKKTIKVLGVCMAFSLFTSGTSLGLYARAGVVRDVPELNVYTDNVHRGMHAEYCDRVYKYDRNYENNGGIKVFAVGNSFVRDWVNVLLESDIANKLDITYCFSSNLNDSYISRISEADIIFVNADSKGMDSVSSIIIDNMKSTAELWGVSTKSFGDTNGNIYNRRFMENYYDMTVTFASVSNEYVAEKRAWGDRLIDFIKPVITADGNVRAFTDDQKFISQDTRHLTQAGAQYYARIFDFDTVFLN